MEQTTNNNIKIVRLQSGEDIMADILQDEENDTIMLDNPMQVIFKRIPTGQTVMMMMPWLPIEIIEENSAVVYSSDILTIIEPKDDLVNYYGSVVIEAQQRMEEKRDFSPSEEEDEDDEDELDEEELFELLREKKNQKIH